ncbi:3-oxoacyl reductase 1 [Coccidioides immitis RMSCC 3703]|uniref:3-oxoacyl reductase 1 n=1 Tax=Coccidioides immitis RMSCC 3703 TaxID=454286 RepID=A0A0J8TVK1_COCIT|nr:3-oxoacyl reductase 1 [Coccidioides immitis RMSCC 3703]
MTEDLFDRHFNTNTRGPIFLAKRMIPHMRPGGAIVFTTSVSVDQGHPGMAVYSASKAAIYSFVQTLAAELARGKDGKEGIRVNCVSPGFVDTPTLGVVDAPKEAVAAFADLGRQSTPLARIARPEEVAKAVAFLGFDATFTTGTEFLMDGGVPIVPLRPGASQSTTLSLPNPQDLTGARLAADAISILTGWDGAFWQGDLRGATRFAPRFEIQ